MSTYAQQEYERRVARRAAFQDRIAALAALPGVDAEAVWNFLGTLAGGVDSQATALANLEIDVRVCGWNVQTARAIQQGIMERGEPRVQP